METIVVRFSTETKEFNSVNDLVDFAKAYAKELMFGELRGMVMEYNFAEDRLSHVWIHSNKDERVAVQPVIAHGEFQGCYEVAYYRWRVRTGWTRI